MGEGFERAPRSIEVVESKDALKELEASGQYVFHGSPHQLEAFEPRQAFSAVDGVSVPDGEPAVFASSEIELPIFKSIFHPSRYEGLDGEFSSGETHGDDMEIRLVVSKDAWQAAHDKEGYVYVLKREPFTPRGGIEWKATQTVMPIAVFHTSLKELGLPVHIE